MEWVETTGDSVTEAKAAAIDLLGIAADEAEFEIINEERRGVFGRVKDQARIRARVRPSAPRPKEGGDRNRNRKRTKNKPGAAKNGNGNRSKGGDTSSSKPAAQKAKNEGSRSGNGNRSRNGGDQKAKKAKAESRPEREPAGPPMSLARQGEEVSDFLGGMLRAFKLEGRIEGTEVDESTIEVNVVGPELGLLIGPRGNTLRAVQELARTVVQRKSGGNAEGRVRIDIGGYREQRRQALGAFALQVAEKVKASGAEQALEPMSAADRKIVHDAVNDLDGVSTVSEGSDPERRVVILPGD